MRLSEEEEQGSFLSLLSNAFICRKGRPPFMKAVLVQCFLYEVLHEGLGRDTGGYVP